MRVAPQWHRSLSFHSLPWFTSGTFHLDVYRLEGASSSPRIRSFFTQLWFFFCSLLVCGFLSFFALSTSIDFFFCFLSFLRSFHVFL